MPTVVADMSMSPDGFVADPSDDVTQVFAWYSKSQPERTTREPTGPGLGLIVYGRRTFEVAKGWGGNHPLGVPVLSLRTACQTAGRARTQPCRSSGIRFFDNLTSTPIELDGPAVSEGNGVTHLRTPCADSRLASALGFSRQELGKPKVKVAMPAGALRARTTPKSARSPSAARGPLFGGDRR